mgnify:CR=1 FL=1
MKIFIAGGAGYIGTRLANYLVGQGNKVTVIDRFWFGDYLAPPVTSIKGNLMDLKKEDLEGFDAVVFLAGLSNDPMANFDPPGNFIENGAAPAFLAFISKAAGVPRYVYASSCSIYGFTDNLEMDETCKSSPQYPYGISKLQGETAIMVLEDDTFRPICLRKGTVGGWSPRMRFDLVVNTMTKFSLTQGKLVVHNPNLWRPLLDIRDAVRAYELAIYADPKITGIFNISYDNYTIGTLAEEIKKELQDHGISVEVETQNRADVRNYKASNFKARTYLNFDPKHDPRSTVREIMSNIDPDSFDFSNKKYYNIDTFKEFYANG